MSEEGRWAARNTAKDLVRNRIWHRLEETHVAVGPAWSMIPNFVGAGMAAWRLAQIPEWKAAKINDGDVVIEAHDSPLDMVATEKELIRTGNRERRPPGVDWERVRPDRFETIPFLAALRDRLVERRKAS